MKKTITGLLNELAGAFTNAPFTLVYGEPVKQASVFLDDEIEIGVLVRTKDGLTRWVGEVDEEVASDVKASTSLQVQVVYNDRERGIQAAWMSSLPKGSPHYFTTVENERAAVHSWLCGFNCGRRVGAEEAAKSVCQLAGRIARGEVR